MKYRVNILNDRRGMKDFLDLPGRIYADDPDWVAPVRDEVSRVLDPSKNPYFFNSILEKFVCYGDGTPLARAVSVIEASFCVEGSAPAREHAGSGRDDEAPREYLSQRQHRAHERDRHALRPYEHRRGK